MSASPSGGAAFPDGVAGACEPSPLVCSLEEFLCGCDGPSPWCQQHFDDYVNDIDQTIESDITPLETSPIDTVGGNRGRYAFASSSDSVLLLNQAPHSEAWVVVGYYSTPGAVCIQDNHQGQGLGAELILFTALNWTGGPPTAGLDEQLFSESGYAAHTRAWHLGVERGLIQIPQPRPVAARALGM